MKKQFHYKIYLFFTVIKNNEDEACAHALQFDEYICFN